MFLRYYGLSEQPFSMTPDPRYLYLSASHREALASLIYGIETGRGFVSLIAEPGMGKTTLLFQFLERFRNSARTVFLFQTQGDTRQFLSNLISDLGLVPDDRDVSCLQRQLNEILIQEARLGRQFVLVIDEAQNLEDSVLESIRMLSNFETSRSKLMQIVLAGQPPLADKLARPELEQLMQRVSIICRLKPFSEQEVVGYINHRLRIAGYKGGQRFTPDAFSMIAYLSEGIPRNINNICFHALSLGFAKGQKMIDRAVIEEVSSDLELDTLKNARVGLHSEHYEPPRQPLGVEGVTLNGGQWAQEARTRIRRGRFSPPAAPGIAGGGWPRRQMPRWPFWAVTFLMFVIAGEIFWGEMPLNTRDQVLTHLVTRAVRTANQVAAKYSSPNTSGSPGTAEPQTTVTHSDGRAGDVPNPVGSNAPETTTAANIDAANKNSSGAGKENAAAPNRSVTDAPAAGDPAPIDAKATPSDEDNNTLDGSTPSALASTGRIVLESNVESGVITINGETNPGWRTPHMFDLPPGMYRISVSQAGYQTWYRALRVTAGNKRWVTADLELPRGVIVIDTEPPGMQVFIDGKAYGPSEVEATLNTGSHEFKVVPPGGRLPFEGSFVLKPGDVVSRKIRWPSETAQPTAGNNPATQKLKTNSHSLKEREQS
ncbi:MAG: PEGA domain-containing protein [Acidobacteria bacterium]|nr:MAG: PEGA domain-containing protein [Acidobacteriota bacterium]